MEKKLFYFLVLISFTVFSQESSFFQDNESVIEFDTEVYPTLIENKSIEIERQRRFSVDIKEKYSSNDFHYKEEKKIEKPKPVIPNPLFGLAFLAFMKFVLPLILAVVVIFIIIKLYIGTPSSLWKSKKTNVKVAEKLISEDEDVENSDIEGLLKQALAENNTRLAVRYYYLLLLKRLSQKEMIKYDKDKTNSEYLFELTDKKIRKDFSYLSYIYSYVWYGEFVLSEKDFLKVQDHYQSFLKTIS